MESNQLMTFGDTRRKILDTIAALSDNSMDVNRGMAIAANMKVLNDNVQAEVNATKMAINAKAAGHDFGRVVAMGQRFIANSVEQLS